MKTATVAIAGRTNGISGTLAFPADHLSPEGFKVAAAAGHIALPTLAAYAASKAGLIAWTEAMASELEGCEVTVAAVCPTFVSGEGMHARTGVKAPWIAGEVPPEKVARAVVKALTGTTHEFLVTPTPTRPLLALQALVPGLVRRLKRTLGLVAYMDRRTGK